MMKKLALVIITLGLSGIFGCAQNPETTDPNVAPTLDTMKYARAAVEVGKITVAEMPEFKASVERMSLDERAGVWLTLEQLHDSVHLSGVAEQDAEFCGEETFLVEAEGGGCSNARCSHSASCGLAQWCCAFGEDATFYQ